MDHPRNFIFIGLINFFIIYVNGRSSNDDMSYCTLRSTRYDCSSEDKVTDSKCTNDQNSENIVNAYVFELIPDKNCFPAEYPLEAGATGKFTWHGPDLYLSNDCRAYIDAQVCHEAAPNRTCIIKGDPHITMTDGKTFRFTGNYSCDYLLTQEDSGHITIKGTFVHYKGKTSRLDKVTIEYNGIGNGSSRIYTLGPGDAVKGGSRIDDMAQLDLPYLDNPALISAEVAIEEEGDFIKLSLLLFDTAVYWDKKKMAALALSEGQFFNRTIGLCGNFDGIMDNDFGGLSAEEFGQQYRVEGSCTLLNCGTPDKEGYEFSAPNPNTLFESTVNVSCADCYGEGPDKSQLTCEADGNWTDVSGCNKKVCGSVPEKEGYVFGDPNPDTTCGSTVSVTCADGYVETPDNPTLSCLSNNSWEIPSGCKNCGPWYMAYHHDDTGSPVSGSKADLTNKVRNGANVRVMIVQSNPYVTSLQNAFVVGTELCAQALLHVSKSGYDKIQSDAYWWFVSVCTTGHWQVSRYNIGEHVSRGTGTSRYALKWFVRDEGQDHLVTLNSNGNVESGSKSAVITAIRKGHHMRVSRTDYSYPCDTLEHSADESLAVCTALWSVSQRTVQRDGYNVKTFTSNAYWWFTLQTTHSDLKVSRWYVGAHTQPVPGNTESKKASKWFADPCWRPVYQHDTSGQLMSGSLASLLDYVRNGYRVKIQFKNLTLEVDDIRIHNGHLCVSLLNDLYTINIDTFAAPARMSWVWRQCCTTGRCETMKYQVGANVETGDNTFEYEALTWFVDTPRKWTRVLSVAKNETVTFGSKTALTNAIKTGSEVRYNLLGMDPNQPDFLTGHLADNLAIQGVEVGAQHVRAINVQMLSTETEVSFNPDPCWFFTVITTRGRLEVSQ